MPTTEGGADRLAGLLRGPEPAGVAALAAADRDALADFVEQALSRQRQQVTAAVDATLRHVPFPLRRVFRRVLLG